MARTANVNYHIHSPSRQAYHIDAGGIVGKLVSPEHAVTLVTLHDVRTGTAASFEHDSVGFFDFPSKVQSFDDNRDWQGEYDQELTAFLARELGAKEVVVFDHTVRVDDPDATRKPARNVHSDYSPDGAKRRLVDILGEGRAALWAQGHFGFINVWRPIENTINTAPLGFVRPASVQDEDWVMLDLIYPDRRGHIMGLVANSAHEWIYQSKMTPADVVAFNIYDNLGKPSVAHSALDMLEDHKFNTPRKSIESRTLIRY